MKLPEPVMLAAPRPCDRCGIPTLWATGRQYKYGRCLEHSAGFWLDVGATGRRLALRVLGAAFPGATVDSEPVRLPPDHSGLFGPLVLRWLSPYDPTPWVRHIRGPLPTTGPCTLCRRYTTIYGAWGRPRCTECDSVHSGPALDGPNLRGKP
jgi:hypothetical protein